MLLLWIGEVWGWVGGGRLSSVWTNPELVFLFSYLKYIFLLFLLPLHFLVLLPHLLSVHQIPSASSPFSFFPLLPVHQIPPTSSSFSSQCIKFLQPANTKPSYPLLSCNSSHALPIFIPCALFFCLFVCLASFCLVDSSAYTGCSMLMNQFLVKNFLIHHVLFKR